MKLNYYADTDSLYIDLSERPSVESRQITEVLFLIMTLKGIWWALTSIMLAEKLILRSSPSISYRRLFKQTQVNHRLSKDATDRTSRPKVIPTPFPPPRSARRFFPRQSIR